MSIFVICIIFIFVIFVVFFAHSLLSDFFRYFFLKNREMILTLESRWNDSISFQGGNEDIETPEKDKNSGGNSLYRLGSSQFSANGRVTTDHQNDNGKEGLKKKRKKLLYKSYNIPSLNTQSCIRRPLYSTLKFEN